MPSFPNIASGDLQVFEDLYRSLHGISPRQRSSAADLDPRDNTPADPFYAGNPELVDDEWSPIASDPDITRLLADLHGCLEATRGSDPCDTGGQERGWGDGEAERQRAGNDTGEDLTSGPVPQLGIVETSDGDSGDEDAVEYIPAKGGSCRSEARRWSAVGRVGGANGGDSRVLQPEMDSTPCRETRHGGIDISRMKIDGSEPRARVGPRPSSAPASCRSISGFSRLSRTSSSCLSRTVNKKLLQATRRLQQQQQQPPPQSADARDSGVSSVDTKEGFGITVNKQIVSALKVPDTMRCARSEDGYLVTSRISPPPLWTAIYATHSSHIPTSSMTAPLHAHARLSMPSMPSMPRTGRTYRKTTRGTLATAATSLRQHPRTEHTQRCSSRGGPGC